MSEPRRFAFVVEETEAGGRFDRVLAARIPDVSRSRLAELIKSGAALLDGRAAKPSEPVEAGWTATVEVPPLEEKRLEPADLPLALL
ncbi:MAG: RNA pseudouridine synthase, partial [Candidatus Polarisedimenticolia bacterium]